MILILLSLLLPHPSATVVDVDVIELNYVLSLCESRDDFGVIHRQIKHVGSFWIFWKLYPDGDYHVRDWVKYRFEKVEQSELVLRNEKGRGVRIRGKVIVEIASLYDREREDLRTWPADRRERIAELQW
jgi:hypothetical protein